MAITWWWLSWDHGVPFADAGSHLFTVVAYRDLIGAGDLSGMWYRSGYYPPATFVVGALATFVGGLNTSAPVLGQNVVYVPMLALGCYQTGRLVGNPLAGLLAVVFALGSPLLIEQFHVFMIDAPQAALAAVVMWLLLTSDHFARLPASIAAGIAVGAGVASKEQFPLFIAGLFAAVLVGGAGWRNWRGLMAFILAALAVGAPWYLANLSELGHYASEGGLANANLPLRGRPPLLSVSNLGWYFWALLNGVLFAPLFAFAAIGVVRATVSCALRRSPVDARRSSEDRRPALLLGLFVGWVGISLTPHHDMRYAMALVPYLAVLGTAWIVTLPRMRRALAITLLCLASTATTLGVSFGLGPDIRVVLAGERVVTDISFGIPAPSEIVLHAERAFNVSAPRRADDIPGLFAAMRRDGVSGVAWDFGESPLGDPVFDLQGLLLLARFTGLRVPDPNGTHFAQEEIPLEVEVAAPAQRWFLTWWDVSDPDHVYLIRRLAYGREPPCTWLSDGTGVWLRRGAGDAPSARPYCP
ncbi:MAG TPA: glycosyltransferase family 39 protein [Conexibacter sp.]|nr:glycosyltransferase family 39 protein [Conexibacter sp.]